MSFNEIELKDGTIVSFSSFSKVGDKALKVVTTDGRSLVIPREKLSDADFAKYTG